MGSVADFRAFDKPELIGKGIKLMRHDGNQGFGSNPARRLND